MRPQATPMARTFLVASLAAGLAALGPASAAPPPDAFCVILIEGIDGFRGVRVLVDEETTMAERSQLFNATDTDGDGVLERDEADAFRRDRTVFWANQTELGLRGLELADEAGPVPALHATTWRQVGHTFHKQAHTQPESFSDPADFETQEVREVRFEPGPNATFVQVRGGRDLTQPTTTTSSPPSTSPQVTIEYVVVRAPPGWTVQSIEGYSYDGPFTLGVGAAEVDVPAFDTKRPYVLNFQRLPAETGGPATQTVTATSTLTVEAPGGGQDRGLAAGAWVLLAAGLAAAVAVRRRL